MGKNAAAKVIAQTVGRRRFILARRKTLFPQNAGRRDILVRQKGKIYDTQVCGSRRACFIMFKSEGHGITDRRVRRLMSLTLHRLYKTLAVWPPPQYAAEGKPALKCRSRPKYWKCSRSKYLKYRRGNTADLTRAVRNGRCLNPPPETPLPDPVTLWIA
jgi:hypothetical protein